MHEHKALPRIHIHFNIRRHLLPHRLNHRFDANLSIKRLAFSSLLYSSHLLPTPTPTPKIASMLRPAIHGSPIARGHSPSYPSLLRHGSRHDDKRPSSHHPLLPCIHRPLRIRILLQDRTSHAITRHLDDTGRHHARELPSQLSHLSALPSERRSRITHCRLLARRCAGRDGLRRCLKRG